MLQPAAGPPHGIQPVVADLAIGEQMAQDFRIARGMTRPGRIPQEARQILNGRMILQHLYLPKTTQSRKSPRVRAGGEAGAAAG